jgi:hypothetical protein
VSIGPRDFRGVLVVIFAEQQAQNRLQTECIQLDGDMDQSEARFLHGED